MGIFYSILSHIYTFFQILAPVGAVAIPIVLYYLGAKETKRKEERDTEIDRRSNLQHYYHNVICPLVKELENINQIRQDRRIKVPEKIALNNNQLYKDAISAEHEEYAFVDYSNMVGYIGKIYMQISNIKKEVYVYQKSYNKIQKYIQYITHIAMSIDLKLLYDQQVNKKITLLIRIFIGQVSLLVGALEGCIIYQVYDEESEQDTQQHLDTIMTELLNRIKNLTGLEFTL